MAGQFLVGDLTEMAGLATRVLTSCIEVMLSIAPALQIAHVAVLTELGKH